MTKEEITVTFKFNNSLLKQVNESAAKEIELLNAKIENLERINNQRYIHKEKIVDELNQLVKYNLPHLVGKIFYGKDKLTVFEKIELLKTKIGFNDSEGKSLRIGSFYTVHRFGFDGNETEFECNCQIVYSVNLSAFCIRLINNDFGYHFEENDDKIIPICSIDGLHENSFSL